MATKECRLAQGARTLPPSMKKRDFRKRMVLQTVAHGGLGCACLNKERRTVPPGIRKRRSLVFNIHVFPEKPSIDT